MASSSPPPSSVAPPSQPIRPPPGLPPLPRHAPGGGQTVITPEMISAMTLSSSNTSASASAYKPRTMERHLQCIDFNKAGNVLVAATDLTGRHWTGSLWYYQDKAQLSNKTSEEEGQLSPNQPSLKSAQAATELEDGIGDALFVGEDGNDILVGLDNGAIEHVRLVYSKEEDRPSFYCLERLATIHEHDSLINRMALNADGKQVLSASYQPAVIILDVDTLAKVRELDCIHRDIIYDLDASKSNKDLFVTASQDGFVALWDAREKDQTACKAKCNFSSSMIPKATQFLPMTINTSSLAWTTDKFSFSTSERLSKSPKLYLCLSRKRDRLPAAIGSNSQNKRMNTFAVCSQSRHVIALEIGSSKDLVKIYDDSRSTDYVRGLAWHPTDDTLWSAGWDSRVLEHKF